MLKGSKAPIADTVAELIAGQAKSIASSTEEPSVERGVLLLSQLAAKGILRCPHGKDLFEFIGTVQL
jgi:hypothetical protein